MSDTPPSGPGFNTAPGSTEPHPDPNSVARQSEVERLAEIKKLWPGLMAAYQERAGGRAQRFYPYILIRSFTGDRGDRPVTLAVGNSSPDIWIAPGDPAGTPAIPSGPGDYRVTAGAEYTIYAHVWNLGRAPSVGIRVEFFWQNFDLPLNVSPPNLIGWTRIDLPPRSSIECHRLVKCPKVFIPQPIDPMNLFVQATAVGDSIDDPWNPATDRHLARAILLVNP